VKYFLTYDPLPVIRKVRQPILILQGEIDRQVTADQADMLAKAAREDRRSQRVFLSQYELDS